MYGVSYNMNTRNDERGKKGVSGRASWYNPVSILGRRKKKTEGTLDTTTSMPEAYCKWISYTLNETVFFFSKIMPREVTQASDVRVQVPRHGASPIR